MTRSGEQTSGPERVWGIQPGFRIEGLPKQFALVAGAVYALSGVIGFFFTGFGNFTEMTDAPPLFGIFHLTPFHNVVHLGVGALWLLAAFVLSRPAAEGVNLGIAGVYVLAAVLGYVGALTFLGITPGLDPDNFLHLITGVVSLLFSGIVPLPDRARA